MDGPKYSRTLGRTGTWLLIATLVLAYAGALWTRDIDVRTARGLACVACGLAYVGLSLRLWKCVGSPLSLPHRRGMAVAYALLMAAILYLARMAGQTFLCIYPTAAIVLQLLPPIEAIAAEALVFGLMAWVVARFSSAHWAIRNVLSISTGYAFVVLFTTAIIRANKARDRSERLAADLEEANARLREQSARMAELAALAERNRLARDIHDGLGHFLTTIHVQLEAAQALFSADPPRALDAVSKAHGLAREALVEVRRSVGSLKADAPPLALVDRLRDLAASVDQSANAGLTVRLDVLGEPRPLEPELEQTLFRAAQEGLTNVFKHAVASRAAVEIDFREANQVAVRVVDDGRGCPHPEGGHGIVGLRERFALLGGQVRAQNASGGGFRLEVQLPAPLAPAAGGA